jgi:hypothetical protein
MPSGAPVPDAKRAEVSQFAIDGKSNEELNVLSET